VSEYTYSSPLPPSSELRAYEAAVPGSGKMIFSNARHMMKVSSEIRRRQAADDSALMQAQIEQMRSDARLRERGQSSAFWLAALSIVVFGALMARFGRPMREMVAEIGFSWAEWRELTFDGPWRPWRAIAGGGEGTGVESGRLRLVKRRGGRKRAPRNEATA
jgi:hypothetical protein